MRILQIGFGVFGQQRCKALASISQGKRIEVDVFDPFISDALVHEQAMGFPPGKLKFISSPNGKYDLAIISVPHDSALEVSREATKFTNRLLVEKPAVCSVDQVQDWRILGKKCEIFVGYNYRFLPHIQKLSQIFATKDLGKLRRFEIFLGHGGSPRDQDSWKMDINRVGGGALLDPGSHCLDLALLYFPNLLEMEARKISTSGFWANKFPEDEITYFFNKEVYIKVHASLIQWRSTFSVEALGEEGYVRLTGRDRSYGNPTFSIGLRWNWHTKGKSQDDTEEHFIFPYENSVQSELLAVLGISTSFINPPATLEDAIQIIYLIESLNS